MAIEPTAQDQYMLELLNRARLNPQAEADLLLSGNLNEGVPLSETISTTPKQPLAFNLKLFQAAQSHSEWMLANNTFDHAGANGSEVWDRATSAGYTWNTIGENLAWRGTTGTPNLTTEVALQHQDLFVDTGIEDRGHRTNMMLPNFREVGISAIVGVFTSNGTPYNSVITTQNFGGDAGTNAFLTGVAYTDKVTNDDFYTVGEGLGNIVINAVGNGQTFTTNSLSSGGYSLRLAPGTYTVTFGGDFNNDGIADTSTAKTVIIGAENVKQDFASDTQFTQGVAVLTTRNDFNNDKKSDILWRNDYGSVALWQMNGATVTSSSLTSVPNIDPSWKVASTGDFNGDGKSDVLWRNTNGSVAVWTMDGATVTSSALTSTPALDNSWKTTGTGDYNGDGKADILWRNDNGSVVVWTMNGATVTSSNKTSTPALDPSWKVAGNSDFDGDGKADILWRNDDGSVALWQMNGAAITASTAVSKVATDWKIAGTGDFNADGKADILWRNDNGSVALWQMDGAAITSSSLTSTPSRDSSQTIAGIGDYNGDRKADILWRKDSGAVEVWEMNGATVVSSTLTSVAADGSNWRIAAPIL
jgi:FG-GAP-like repeat/Cysteine-rich secretory protein family